MAEKADIEYSGATLDIHGMSEEKEPVPDVKFAGHVVSPTTATSNDPAQRRESTQSTRTTPSSFITLTEHSAQRYFSFRAQQTGQFAKAVQAVQDENVKPDEDGSVKGIWLLAEIDHWDNEREKLVLLCQKTIIIIHYDFIRFTNLYVQRIPLHQIESIRLGQLAYPSGSFMSSSRDHGGLRICWGKESELTWKQRWNPWSGEIPFTTLAHHPLHYLPREAETAMYNMEDLYNQLVPAVQNAYKAMKPGEAPPVEEGNVTINSYASIWSMVYNQSRLGFNKERGGLSY